VSILALASATLSAERLPIRLYSSADGLPSQFVERVFRDSHGLLWFATREGLSRFDGSRFVTYGIGDGLPHLGINDILEDRSGVYWIATNGAGVVRFDSAATPAVDAATSGTSTRFVTYPVGHTALSAHVNVVYQDAAGRIWAGSDAGLFVWRESTGAFARAPLGWPAREDEIAVHKALLDDGEGGLWVGTSLGLVRRTADGRAVWYRSPFPDAPAPESLLPETSAAVRAVLRDDANRLWIGSHDGLFVYVPPEPEGAGEAATGDSPWRAAACAALRDRSGRLVSMTLPTSPGTVCRFQLGSHGAANWISALLEAEPGAMWIGSLDGLVHVASDGRIRSFGVPHGLPDPTVVSMEHDRDGNLWVATTSGAARLASDGLVTYTEADGLGAPGVNWIGEDPEGVLHVVSGAWLVSHFDEPRFKTKRLPVPPDPLPAWGTPAAMMDRGGDWWVVTRHGLFHVGRGPGEPKRTYRRLDGLPADDALRTFEDVTGAMWISTGVATTGRLARLDRQTRLIRVFSDADGLETPSTATAFAEDAAGGVWIGFQYGGVARFMDGRFRMYGREDGLPPGQISSLHVDAAGRLWMGSTAGASRAWTIRERIRCACESTPWRMDCSATTSGASPKTCRAGSTWEPARASPASIQRRGRCGSSRRRTAWPTIS
jgi:ligand-binding sensor domain-containing protein